MAAALLPFYIAGSSNLPVLSFSFFVLLVVLMIVTLALHYLAKMRRTYSSLHGSLRAVAHNVTEIKSCDIANLKLLSQIVTQQGFDLLDSATKQLEDDSERLYHGKWITKPSNVYNFDNLLTAKQYTLFTYEIPLQIIAVSSLLSAIFWLSGFSFISSEQSSVVLSVSSLPLLLGAFMALLLAITVQRNRYKLQQAINYLVEVTMRRIPVFEELAGTAVLVDSFVRYDREMNESVAYLAESVDKLSHKELAEEISANIREVMLNEIAPAYKKASDALVDLAENLADKQSKGMAELADNFAAAVSRNLTERLQGFYTEMDKLTQSLQAGSSQVDIALDNLAQAKADQLELQQNTQLALQQLAEVRQQWQDDMQANSEAIKSIAATTSNFENIYNGEQNQLADRLNNLSSELQVFSTEMNNLLSALVNENNNTRNNVQSLEDSNNRLLSDLHQLSQEMAHNADTLSRQSAQINDSLAGLNESLNRSVNQFSYQLSAGVKNTLNEFDESLAEISLRLANTTTEIKDSAQSISNSLRADTGIPKNNQQV